MSNPHGNNTTCNSGNATICMVPSFFERPSSVIERSKKTIEGVHSVPEPANPKFFYDKWLNKRSETPSKKYVKAYKLSEERTNSKDMIKKLERYTELSSILNSK